MPEDSGEKCLKKTNILVYQTPTGEKKKKESPCAQKQPSFQPPICRPKTKQIRICTGKEMKKMCAPKLCECPAPPKSRGLLGLLGFGLKAAIAAAAVYVTYDIGIWGSTDDTQDLYRAYCRLKTEPKRQETMKWDPPSCDTERDLFRPPSFNPYSRCDQPPIDQERKGYEYKQCWNKAVAKTFSVLAGLPYNLIDRISGVKKEEEEEVEIVQCIPFDELPEEEKILNKYK